MFASASGTLNAGGNASLDAVSDAQAIMTVNATIPKDAVVSLQMPGGTIINTATPVTDANVTYS
jgi:hypothetical protein